MKMNALLLVLLLAVGCAKAGEIESVNDQEKAWLLREVSVLMNKSDPREFPAIIRLVSLPVPLEECEPNIATEEACPQEDLYLVLTNWDLAADIHAFKIGRANTWRVDDLVLQEKNNQSFWTASLTLESDRYTGSKKVTEAVRIKITNTADQYALELEGKQ